MQIEFADIFSLKRIKSTDGIPSFRRNSEMFLYFLLKITNSLQSSIIDVLLLNPAWNFYRDKIHSLNSSKNAPLKLNAEYDTLYTPWYVAALDVWLIASALIGHATNKGAFTCIKTSRRCSRVSARPRPPSCGRERRNITREWRASLIIEASTYNPIALNHSNSSRLANRGSHYRPPRAPTCGNRSLHPGRGLKLIDTQI